MITQAKSTQQSTKHITERCLQYWELEKYCNKHSNNIYRLYTPKKLLDNDNGFNLAIAWDLSFYKIRFGYNPSLMTFFTKDSGTIVIGEVKKAIHTKTDRGERITIQCYDFYGHKTKDFIFDIE